MLRRLRPLLIALTAAVGLLVPLTAGVAQAATSTASAPVAAPGGAAGHDITVTLPFGGVDRSYTLFVPDGLPASPVPLVVVLHYLGGTSASMETLTGFDGVAGNNNVLVAYPQGIGDSWNGGGCCGLAVSDHVDDVGFLTAVIHDVEARYPVDPRRIAMGGWSNGGIMTYRYACAGASRVRTFFIGSGVAVPPSCALGQPDRFLHMHGLLDTTVPWAGTRTSPFFTNGLQPPVASTIGYVNQLDGCGTFTSSIVNPLVTKYTATGCPAGASYTVMLSSSMTHEWATGGTAAAAGMDETGLTWGWLGWAFAQG